jgi:hypothetical protein
MPPHTAKLLLAGALLGAPVACTDPAPTTAIPDESDNSEPKCDRPASDEPRDEQQTVEELIDDLRCGFEDLDFFNCNWRPCAPER